MKSIKEWRQAANTILNENFSHKLYKAMKEKVEEAKENVENYNKYNILIKPDVLKRFKKAMKKLKNKPNLMLICLEGDLENVHVHYSGSWHEDNYGKVRDTDVDGLKYSWCSEHDGNLEEVSEVINAICSISEFKEILKILKKISG